MVPMTHVTTDALGAVRIEPGTVLDRYECLYAVGKGGMASVWAARLQGKHGFERLVAVKTVLPQHSRSLDHVKMLLDEGYLLSRIRHPNVASILDMGEQDGIVYLVFEWVEGESLSKLQRALHKKALRMPLKLALRLTADTCAGLHAAHEVRDAAGSPLQLVHRDVSPPNVMISTAGDVRLIDFGIAKALDRVTDETRAGSIKGKVMYMAPEQVRGEPLDRRVDIWAAGVMLYQMVTGHPPFGTSEQTPILEGLINNREPQPLPPNVPPLVATALVRALRPPRDERYATAADMQRDLEQAIRSIAGAVSPSDVAAFLRKHVGDRIDARRGAISEALERVSKPSCPRTVAVRQSLASVSGCRAIGAEVEAAVAPTLVPEAARAAAAEVPPEAPPPVPDVVEQPLPARASSGSLAVVPAVAPGHRPMGSRTLLFAAGGACLVSAAASALVVVAVQRLWRDTPASMPAQELSASPPARQEVPSEEREPRAMASAPNLEPSHQDAAVPSASTPEPPDASGASPPPPVPSASAQPSSVPKRKPPRRRPVWEPSAI